MESASVAVGHADEHEHHGPPEAHHSSRVEAQFLGMLLFIISEVMLFGAFFTAYFFLRVVAKDTWPGPGMHIPRLVAGVNTAILFSSRSRCTGPSRPRAAATARRCAQASSPPSPSAPASSPFRSTSTSSWASPRTTARRPPSSTRSPGLHGAHVFVGLNLLLYATIRAFRGHFSPKEHRGVEVPGIYWHFVDVMWLIVYTTVYII